MSISDFDDMMTDSITHEELSGRDAYGAPSYGSPTTYEARVIYVSKWVRDAQNQEVMSKGEVWIQGNPAVASEDRITLPDSTTPAVLIVERFSDENGVHHTKVTFGQDER